MKISDLDRKVIAVCLFIAILFVYERNQCLHVLPLFCLWRYSPQSAEASLLFYEVSRLQKTTRHSR